MDLFSDKVVLITGGAGGIGIATAKASQQKELSLRLLI